MSNIKYRGLHHTWYVIVDPTEEENDEQTNNVRKIGLAWLSIIYVFVYVVSVFVVTAGHVTDIIAQQ